jgi:hypothetical protein
MQKSLLFIFLLLSSLTLQAQKDSTGFNGYLPQKDDSRITSANVSIYPVPVRENSFTVKADKDISFIKITNIIGQDVFRLQCISPQQLLKIPLDNPRRGMYIVTLIFSDGTRVVKKIMVEESE